MNPLQGRFKRIELLSRQTRHHRVCVNQIYEEKLHKRIDHLRDEYWHNITRLKSNELLERQRKQLLEITVKHIAQEQSSQKPPDNDDGNLINRSPLPGNKRSIMKDSSCCISRTCRLYPCQPISQYTSFTSKDNDRSFQRPKTTGSDSTENFQFNMKSMCKEMNETNHAGHRQLVFSMYNQNHLAHRHEFFKRTMANLNEQSRLLQEQLAEKRFSYVDDYQNNFRKAIQRHLRSSAKFYG